MDSIFLGMSTHILSWIIAFLLAGLSLYFFVRSDYFATALSWMERNSPNDFIQDNSRLVLVVVWMASIGFSLAILMNLLPNQDSFIFSKLEALVPSPTWNQYITFYDDLIIISGLLLLLFSIPIVKFLFSKVCQAIEHLRETRFHVVRIQNLELFTPDQMVGALLVIARYIRMALIAALSILYIIMVLSLYPQTDGLAQTLLINISDALLSVWDQVLSFIPNMIALFVVAVITRFVLNVLRFLYTGLQKGKIRFSSIHPEVVEPTYQLLRFLVIAFALVAAFPYIPGSSSPVFRGLSIFVGFLISLGSTSLVTNIISGIVLTYSRGLKIGDRVKIDGTVGDVIDRTLLVTRVKTIKNEVITIPNVIVMQNEIINYSAEARGQGLILHTSVTIGYDESWKHVEDLLISAALNTGDIVHNPEPFVLKTSLDNYYICYELNAYTNNPAKMADIYSELHENILDKFNQADVEIMSPTYFAFRDGHKTTIPQVDMRENGNGNGSKNKTRRSSSSLLREKTQPLGSRS